MRKPPNGYWWRWKNDRSFRRWLVTLSGHGMIWLSILTMVVGSIVWYGLEHSWYDVFYIVGVLVGFVGWLVVGGFILGWLIYEGPDRIRRWLDG